LINNFKATHRNGGVSVTNQRGELVCYIMLESVFVAPAAPEEEAYQAGEAADRAIDVAARNAGASSVVLVLGPEHPHFPEEKWVRIITRPITQTVTMPEVASTTSAHATPYLN
jgi:hypothetical protein